LKIKCKVFGTLVEFSLHLLFQILLQRYNIQWFSGFSAAPIYKNSVNPARTIKLVLFD